MAKATRSERPAHAKDPGPARCIALAGKGVPRSASLEEAVEAVAATALALRELTRRRGHEWKPPDPEVRLHAPAGVRGGTGWIVRVLVPGFVTAREVGAAVRETARGAEVAKNIRLVAVHEGEGGAEGPHGGDRLREQIRRTRTGGPQHRARELR